MMSLPPDPIGPTLKGLGGGCLAGLGLATLFLLISGGIYLLGQNLDIPNNVFLLAVVASGPVCGSAAVIIVFFLRSLPAQRQALDALRAKQHPPEDS